MQDQDKREWQAPVFDRIESFLPAVIAWYFGCLAQKLFLCVRMDFLPREVRLGEPFTASARARR
jgi:hypothetical protein